MPQLSRSGITWALCSKPLNNRKSLETANLKVYQVHLPGAEAGSSPSWSEKVGGPCSWKKDGCGVAGLWKNTWGLFGVPRTSSHWWYQKQDLTECLSAAGLRAFHWAGISISISEMSKRGKNHPDEGRLCWNLLHASSAVYPLSCPACSIITAKKNQLLKTSQLAAALGLEERRKIVTSNVSVIRWVHCPPLRAHFQPLGQICLGNCPFRTDPSAG